MNNSINRKNCLKALSRISIAAVAFICACGVLSKSAFAQQANVQALNGVTGTVVRVRLASPPLPQKANKGVPVALPSLVEVGVQVADGQVYVATADRVRQPRLGSSVMLVTAGDGLRIAQ